MRERIQSNKLTTWVEGLHYIAPLFGDVVDLVIADARCIPA